MSALSEPNAPSKYKVHVFSSRPAADAWFGDNFKHVLIDYNSSTGLADKLRGIDVLVLALSSQQGDILATSKRFLDAAVEAGVPSVLLSEFTGNLDLPNVKELLAWNSKLAVRSYARELQEQGKLAWSSVSCSSFLEWALERGFSGFNIKDNVATLIDDGQQPFTTTSLETTAKATVAILKKFENGSKLNRTFFVSDASVTQRELLKLFERHTARQWTIKHVDSSKQLAEGLTLYKNGQYGPGYGKIITSVVIGSQAGYAGIGHFPEKAKQDMQELGIASNDSIVEKAIVEELRKSSV